MDFYDEEETKSDMKNGESTGLQKTNLKKIIFISAVFILILTLFSTMFALVNMGNETIIGNVTINNISVKGLTKEEAIQKLSSNLDAMLLDKDITLSLNEYSESFSPEDIFFIFDVEAAVDKVYLIGRTNNILINNYQILSALSTENNVQCEYLYDENNLAQIIDNVDATIPGRLIDNSHYIEDDNLFIVRGQSGLCVEKNKLKNLILGAIINEIDKIEIPVVNKDISEIDIEQVYSEVHAEPKDAYYTKIDGKFTIYPHVLGVSFDIEEAKNIIKEQKDEYTIKLAITYPDITTNQIGSEAFPDLLAVYTTKYDGTSANRSENVRLSAEKINGRVLMPDEIFSYNDTLGKRTIENGYKEAPVILGGQYVQGVGGGICQISTTLYNTVLLSNLEIVSRTNHGLPVGYVPASRDATVSWGTIDFQFKNSRKYPIKIIASANNGIAKVEIYGIKEDVEYEVVIESSVTSTIPYSTTYEYVSFLGAGQEKVIQSGANGYRSTAYRVLKLNGVEISRTFLSQDAYGAMNRIIQIGTYASPDPEPEPPSGDSGE